MTFKVSDVVAYTNGLFRSRFEGLVVRRLRPSLLLILFEVITNLAALICFVH